MYSIYKYLILLPLVVIDTMFCTFWTWAFSYISGKWAGVPAALWAKWIQLITPMPVEVIGEENIEKGQSYVIIANHQSAYDIIAIYGSLPVDFRWVMKKELRKVPLIGFASQRCGHIFIDRSSARNAYNSIQEAKQILADGGASVVIFPEGTRSGKPEMGKFKHGAFHLAFDLGLPILPVTIKDTCKVMPDGIASLRSGHAQLIIHKPVDPTPYQTNKEELIDMLHDTIQAAAIA